MAWLLACKDIDLNDRNPLEFVGFKVPNSALVLHNQFQREEQEKDQTFFKFMLALRKFLIQSISKDLLWKELQTIRLNKDGKNMGVPGFARALDDMQSKLIDKQAHKSITEEVKLRKFLNNISYVIKKSLTSHLTDDMTLNQIVTKSEQFEAANRVANAEHTKPGYPHKAPRYTNATSTRSSYVTQQPRPDKGQPQQNRQATQGGRSTVSAGTKNSDWDKIKKTLSEHERMRRIREKACYGADLQHTITRTAGTD